MSSSKNPAHIFSRGTMHNDYKLENNQGCINNVGAERWLIKYRFIKCQQDQIYIPNPLHWFRKRFSTVSTGNRHLEWSMQGGHSVEIRSCYQSDIWWSKIMEWGPLRLHSVTDWLRPSYCLGWKMWCSILLTLSQSHKPWPNCYRFGKISRSTGQRNLPNQMPY